jgi:hypothetical protein
LPLSALLVNATAIGSLVASSLKQASVTDL